MSPAERTAVYAAAVELLAKLHSLDLKSLKLEGFGKGPGYCKRQVSTSLCTHDILLFSLTSVLKLKEIKTLDLFLKVSTWTKQYTASAHRDIPAMNELSDWLMSNLPDKDDEVTLVHGDFRLDNLIFHPTEVRFPVESF